MTKASCAKPHLYPIIKPLPRARHRQSEATSPRNSETITHNGRKINESPSSQPLLAPRFPYFLPACRLLLRRPHVVPTPSQRPSPEGISRVSHCDTSWPASTDVTNVTMSHFCDTHSDTKSCHTVTLSGQLAQCHKCHTFQLQKSVFSYNRCDIVTSLPRTAPIPTHRRTL